METFGIADELNSFISRFLIPLAKRPVKASVRSVPFAANNEKSGSVRFAGARTYAREKSGSDLHAFGAERECCREASPICDPARHYHGKFDNVHYLE
jgi:hypothetical protein